jgi:hypothetical protein
MKSEKILREFKADKISQICMGLYQIRIDMANGLSIAIETSIHIINDEFSLLIDTPYNKTASSLISFIDADILNINILEGNTLEMITSKGIIKVISPRNGYEAFHVTDSQGTYVFV